MYRYIWKYEDHLLSFGVKLERIRVTYKKYHETLWKEKGEDERYGRNPLRHAWKLVDVYSSDEQD